MRSMTYTEMVNNIVHAWEIISPETIIKSFRICGHAMVFNPDTLLCMKEDALDKLKQLLAFPTHKLEPYKLEVLPEGLVPSLL